MHKNYDRLSKFVRRLKSVLQRYKNVMPDVKIDLECINAEINKHRGRLQLRTEFSNMAAALIEKLNKEHSSEFDAEELTAIKSLGDQIGVLIADFCRKEKASATLLKSGAVSFDGAEQLGVYVMHQAPPWMAIDNFRPETPGMITSEEASYYAWITRFYKGRGRVVELGPWLGSSTMAIHAGLVVNPHFRNESLLVFDDFIWRKEWMDPYVNPEDRLPNHANFRSLFDRYTAKIAKDLVVGEARFAIYDGNELVPPLEWSRGGVEILFVDCGRTIEANEGWYNSLVRFFIPGVTLIVMQDWRLARELPRQWYNQTMLFTESKGAHLQLIHEVSDGGIATFLYVGNNLAEDQ